MKYIKVNIFTLLILACISRLSIDIYLPSLPNMLKALDTNYSKLQFTLTAFMIGYAISVLFWGTLSDRFGRKIIIVVSMVIYTLATFCCIIADSIIVLIIARFFQAFGSGAGTVLSRIIAKEIFSRELHTKVLTYLSTGVALSPIIAPIIGGYLETKYGWRSSFVLLFVVAVIDIIFILIFIKDNNENLNKNATKMHFIMSCYKELLSSRSYILYSLSISLASCLMFTFVAFSPFIFQHVLKVTAFEYGFLFALSVTGFIVGVFITRKLIARTAAHNLIITGALICSVTSIAIFAAALTNHLSIFAMIIPVIIMMCGIGIIMLTCQIAIMDLFPKIIGTATSMFFFLQMTTNSLMSIIILNLEINSYLLMSIVMIVTSALLCFSLYFLSRIKQG